MIINKPECRPVIGMHGISVSINHDWRPSIQSNNKPGFSLSCNCQNENKQKKTAATVNNNIFMSRISVHQLKI